jgi:hypothetical protein
MHILLLCRRGLLAAQMNKMQMCRTIFMNTVVPTLFIIKNFSSYLHCINFLVRKDSADIRLLKLDDGEPHVTAQRKE